MAGNATFEDAKDEGARLALATELATKDGVLNTELRDRYVATFTAAAGMMDQIKDASVGYTSVGTGPYYTLRSDWKPTIPENITLEGMRLSAHLPYDYNTRMADGTRVANVTAAPEAPRENREREIAITNPKAFPLKPETNREVASLVGNMLGIFRGDWHLSPNEARFAAAVTHVLTRGEITRTGTAVGR